MSCRTAHPHPLRLAHDDGMAPPAVHTAPSTTPTGVPPFLPSMFPWYTLRPGHRRGFPVFVCAPLAGVRTFGEWFHEAGRFALAAVGT